MLFTYLKHWNSKPAFRNKEIYIKSYHSYIFSNIKDEFASLKLILFFFKIDSSFI